MIDEETINIRIKWFEKMVDKYIDINKPDYLEKNIIREYYRGKWDAYREIKNMLKK